MKSIQKQQQILKEAEESEDEDAGEIKYPAFLEALSAVCCYKQPDPYVTWEINLERFIANWVTHASHLEQMGTRRLNGDRTNSIIKVGNTSPSPGSKMRRSSSSEW